MSAVFGRWFLYFSLSCLMTSSVIAQASMIVRIKGSDSQAGLHSQTKGWKYLRHVDLYLVESNADPLLQGLKVQGDVDVLEDLDITLETLPNDPMVGDVDWIAEQDSPFDIGLSKAWESTTGDDNIIVAIIDTGIDLSHPDLAGNLWTNAGEVGGNGIDDDGDGFVDDIHGYNFWDGDSNIQDDNDHGSHLAGIIGAVGNNDTGIAGINWHVRLMALKFTDENGAGSTVKAIEAIDYAIGHGARVINASWTVKVDGGLSGAADLLKQAIEKAGESGVLFVTAAGNQFRTNKGLNADTADIYPTSFVLPTMVSVAAMDTLGGLAPYSNYGDHTVDLAAPGASILSTLPGGNYGTMSGTSVAAAFVSGAAALAISENPTLTPQTLKSLLTDSATERYSLTSLVRSAGSLNVGQLISQAAPQQQSSPSTAINGVEPEFSASQISTSGCSLVVSY